MRTLFLFLLCSLPAAANNLEIQVVSYNIKGLPSVVMSGDFSDARYPLMGKLVAEKAEILLLQEAFSDQVPALLKAAAFPHQSVGPAAGTMLGVGSGLVILSRYPILYEASEVFGAKACLSWDCLSNKGVQMVRLGVPGLPRPLEVYNTHLQAGREDTKVRREQVKTLLKFFSTQHVKGNPVIFAGDFNFRPGLGQKSYLDFSSGTGFSHAGKFCLEKGCTKVEDSGWHGLWQGAVDHQFYSSTGPVQILPLSVNRSFRERVEGIRLSDHPTHEVRYKFGWSVGPTMAGDPPRAPASVD